MFNITIRFHLNKNNDVLYNSVLVNQTYTYNVYYKFYIYITFLYIQDFFKPKLGKSGFLVILLILLFLYIQDFIF